MAFRLSSRPVCKTAEMLDHRRALYFLAGWLFVVLAALGLVLPVLPTTPFVLLAGSCFLRSSPRSRAWLARSRWFGPLLRDWDEHRAVRRPVKLLAVGVVTVVIALTLLGEMRRGVKAAVLVVGAMGLFVIWRLPVVPPTPRDHPEPSPEPHERP